MLENEIIEPNRMKTEGSTIKMFLSASFELAEGREMTAGTSLQHMFSPLAPKNFSYVYLFNPHNILTG